jgi:hypothetical protein
MSPSLFVAPAFSRLRHTALSSRPSSGFFGAASSEVRFSPPEASICYCDGDDEVILADLIRQGVPEEALPRTCCWSRISQVRGRTFSGSEKTPSWDPDGDIWTELCRKRGYLQGRQDPRGF